MNQSAPFSGLFYGILDSPLGPLVLTGNHDALHSIHFPTSSHAVEPMEDWQRDDTVFANVFRQLEAYFAGDLTEFDVKLHFDGSDFQNSVWRALCDIPYGTTCSYGALAAAIGNPKASRAVGGANNANPLPIIVPCHRVIGADKSMTGFGGGIDIKEFLLELEGAVDIQPRLL
ncbi:MAG: cysteine methyltransferase [Hyphomicrobiales bacterium]|nr:MAG: cysteine methyltransferase [Hyphomicrobiales bacterium]